MKNKFDEAQLERMSAHPWLTDRERDVFERFYRHGQHIEDIAADLDVSRGTINNTLRSVRHKTR